MGIGLQESGQRLCLVVWIGCPGLLHDAARQLLGPVGHSDGAQVGGTDVGRIVGSGAGQHRLGDIRYQGSDLIPTTGLQRHGGFERAKQRLAARLAHHDRGECRLREAGRKDVAAHAVLDLDRHRLGCEPLLGSWSLGRSAGKDPLTRSDGALCAGARGPAVPGIGVIGDGAQVIGADLGDRHDLGVAAVPSAAHGKRRSEPEPGDSRIGSGDAAEDVAEVVAQLAPGAVEVAPRPGQRGGDRDGGQDPGQRDAADDEGDAAVQHGSAHVRVLGDAALLPPLLADDQRAAQPEQQGRD